MGMDGRAWVYMGLEYPGNNGYGYVWVCNGFVWSTLIVWISVCMGLLCYGCLGILKTYNCCGPGACVWVCIGVYLMVVQV